MNKTWDGSERRRPARIFRYDPQAVEVVTGWYITTLGLWCWLGGWFGTFLPGMSCIHGWEWVVAMVACPYGIWHAFKSHTDDLTRRASQSFWAAGVFFGFAMVLWQNQSWRIPGVPALLLGTATQGWVYLRLKRWIQ